MGKFFYLILIFLAFGFSAAHGQAPDWRWAQQIIGTDWSQGYDVATDSENSVYVSGFFGDSARFGSLQFWPPDQGAYVVKYDSLGAVKWVRTFPSTSGSFAERVVVNSLNEIILLGRFAGTLTAGAFTLSTAAVYNDFFLVKLDASGNILWAKQSGNVNNIQIADLEVDINDFIYIAGDNSSPQVLSGLFASEKGMFILKLDSGGNAFRLIQEEGIYSYSIAIDSNFSVWHTGMLFDTAIVAVDTLLPTSWEEYVWNGTGYDTLIYTNSDFTFIRFDSSGIPLVAKKTDSRAYGYPTYATAAENAGLFTCGYIHDTTDFWGTTIYPDLVTTAFVLHLDSMGNIVWHQYSIPINPAAVISPRDIAADSAFVYLTGFSRGSTSFAGLALPGASGYNTTFVVKLDLAGNGVWAVCDSAAASRNEAHGLAHDANSNIILTGFFEDSVQFGPFHLNSYTNPWLNMMVMKLSSIPLGFSESRSFPESPVSVYPNPTAGEVTVLVQENVLMGELFDALGRSVERFDWQGTGPFRLTIHTDGMYFLCITTHEGRKVRKIIRRE
jgi:hypothetical protein